MLRTHDVPSTLKKGSSLYSCCAWEEEEGKVKTEIDTWTISHIRKMPSSVYEEPGLIFYAIRDVAYNRIGTGKQSTKKWADYIPQTDRRKFQKLLPYGLFTTKLRAVRYELKICQNELKTILEDIEQDPELEHEWARDITVLKKSIKALKARITKLTNRRK